MLPVDHQGIIPSCSVLRKETATLSVLTRSVGGGHKRSPIFTHREGKNQGSAFDGCALNPDAELRRAPPDEPNLILKLQRDPILVHNPFLRFVTRNFRKRFEKSGQI